jgi:hypothetical protein
MLVPVIVPVRVVELVRTKLFTMFTPVVVLVTVTVLAVKPVPVIVKEGEV